ncbi:LysR family transcriptional regulator [Pseudomonas sp. RIT-To-2]|uniref:LysR family transcriptional regulator n=1 Tax=Pseudomonas sp. RIT-To-2 TaxID=3462541 RepID=UPI0040475CC5
MRAFINVVETGSFTAAGHAMELSTPQISRAVTDLENTINTRLLQRNTRNQALTEAGALYLESCKDIIARVEDAAAQASLSYIQPKGTLRVRSNTELGIECLMPLVHRYTDQFPEVTVDLTLAGDKPSLIDDNQDVLITLSRQLPDSDQVAYHVGSFFSVVCASPSYLQTHGTPRSPADLNHHQCLRLADSLYADRWEFNGDESPVVIKPGQTFRVNQPEAVAYMAAAGTGVCVLPNFVASKAFSQGSLVRVLPSHTLHERSVYALYPSRRFVDAKIKSWVDVLREGLPKVLAAHAAVVNTPRLWVDRAERQALS